MADIQYRREKFEQKSHKLNRPKKCLEIEI